MEKLTANALAALREYNLRERGRGIIEGNGVITDTEAIERLKLLTIPGETISDTVIRLVSMGGSAKQ